MRTKKLLALAVLALAGCPNNASNPRPDMSFTPPKPDMSVTVFSCCGHPGDTGNPFGVGQFCDPDPCTGTKAVFCATLGGDAKQHFCTFICTPPGDGGADSCGDNAKCACQGAPPCGCVPTACLSSAPDGC